MKGKVGRVGSAQKGTGDALSPTVNGNFSRVHWPTTTSTTGSTTTSTSFSTTSTFSTTVSTTSSSVSTTSSSMSTTSTTAP